MGRYYKKYYIWAIVFIIFLIAVSGVYHHGKSSIIGRQVMLDGQVYTITDYRPMTSQKWDYYELSNGSEIRASKIDEYLIDE